MALFCKDCANLLLPAAEDQQLKYVCRTCAHQEMADENRVYYHSLDGQQDKEAANDIQPENLIADPTLPRARVRCPNQDCSGAEAVWFQTVAREQERMRLTFVCLTCMSNWQG